jgi:hypothetical protein
MRLQLLLTAGSVLLLSTIASSNECARYSHKCEGSPAKTSTTAQPAKQADSAKPAKPAKPGAVTADTESSTLVINKLLYI